MYQTHTSVNSPKARGYFETFCKHFARKVQVDKQNNRGVIHFGMGECQIDIDEQQLIFICVADTLASMEMVRHIVDLHITRLGDFRQVGLLWTGDSSLNYAAKNQLYKNNDIPASTTTGLRIIGAGLGRTGTTSLKLALEMLLGGRCYHMAEVSAHPEHISTWSQAYNGKLPDWKSFLKDYIATVDWPGATFWSELHAGYPDALVILSTRDPESWWESCHETIFQVLDKPDATAEWKSMINNMFAAHDLHTPITKNRAIKAFNTHNQRVIEHTPKNRLLVWKIGDGWEPLCTALQCALPDEPFPRINTREQWKKNGE